MICSAIERTSYPMGSNQQQEGTGYTLTIADPSHFEVRLNSLEAKMERLTEGHDIVFCLHDFSAQFATVVFFVISGVCHLCDPREVVIALASCCCLLHLVQCNTRQYNAITITVLVQIVMQLFEMDLKRNCTKRASLCLFTAGIQNARKYQTFSRSKSSESLFRNSFKFEKRVYN